MYREEHTKEELLKEIVDLRRELVALQTLAATQHRDHGHPTDNNALLALSAAIGTILAGNDSLRTILQRCAEAIVQHLGVATVGIWTLQPATDVFEMQASAGSYLPVGEPDGRLRLEDSMVRRIAQERHPYVTHAVLDDLCLDDQGWIQRSGIEAFAGYPLLMEARLLGVMLMFAPRPFPPAVLKALEWVAGVMAMGVDRMGIADALARSVAKIVRMNKRLRRQSFEVDELTYLASHDLQEPIRKLMTFSGLLRQDMGDSLPERAARDLAFITDAATRMHLLLHNLLELSQLGSVPMRCEPVAMHLCIDHALTALRASFSPLDAVITRDPVSTVLGDRSMLTQLYQQLLSNALKFRGVPRLTIHCSAERCNGQMVFGVKDNGIGIRPAHHEEIFVPFKRLHARGVYAGTGIGLAICRRVVERHGGQIWVESDVGQGAHFKFILESAAHR